MRITFELTAGLNAATVSATRASSIPRIEAVGGEVDVVVDAILTASSTVNRSVSPPAVVTCEKTGEALARANAKRKVEGLRMRAPAKSG